jgi:hypothetical protein
MHVVVPLQKDTCLSAAVVVTHASSSLAPKVDRSCCATGAVLLAPASVMDGP